MGSIGGNSASLPDEIAFYVSFEKENNDKPTQASTPHDKSIISVFESTSEHPSRR